jgi:Bacterial RNA polymerase, alpha chain C terminal domain
MMGLSMDLNAEGWHRNMGRKQIGSVKITSATVLNEGDVWPFNDPAVRIGEDGVTMGWRQAELSLNGDYLVTVELPKTEVARLFLLLFGPNLAAETLARYGFKVDADNFAAEMLLDKPIGDIIDLLSKHKNRRANETPIEMDALSPRSANCLMYMGITTYEKLARLSESELLRIPNFGRRSLNEVKETLLARGLRLANNEQSAVQSSDT